MLNDSLINALLPHASRNNDITLLREAVSENNNKRVGRWKNTKRAEDSRFCEANVSLRIKPLLKPSESHLHVLTPSLIVYLFFCFSNIKPD